ncbi:MAG: L,D-transpeptidase [Roseimicrobium sp.]
MNPPSIRLIATLVRASLLGLAVLATSCVTRPRPAYSVTFDPPVVRPTNPSAVKVKLSTSAQRVYVTEGDRVLLATPCSVGMPSCPTRHGHYTIYNKQFNRRRISSPGSGYPMTYWMEFATGYGMHWGFVKPYPCTHGCVRLPIKSAQKIFSIVKTGTPLHIAASHPEDATVGASLPLLDDSAMPDPPWSYMISPQVFKDAELGKFYTY